MRIQYQTYTTTHNSIGFNRTIFELILVLAILLVSCMHLSAQYTVTSAEEIGLRPKEPHGGTDILGPYFDTEDPNERGCWVHHHPNGADFVVTPKSWTETPNDTRTKLIYEAMTAITDSRNALGRYGNLSTNLYYILDDTPRPGNYGKAFWIVNKSCWMRSGVPSVHGLTGIDRQQVYAHEIGHCMIMENLHDYNANFNLNDWFDESVAEYLSTQVYPMNNMEHRFSMRFAYSLPFRQEYYAYPLWKYFVMRSGEASLFTTLQSLSDLTTLETRRAYMRNTGFDKMLHNFYFDFYRDNIMDSDALGIIPSDKSTLKIVPIVLDPMQNKVDIQPLPNDRLNGIQLEIPPGYELSLSPLKGNTATIHQSLIEDEDYFIRNWNSQKTFKGDCEDATTVLTLSSHLNDEPLEGLFFNYALTEIKAEDCAECLISADTPSEMDLNPENEINSVFKFDYKIEAVMEIGGTTIDNSVYGDKIMMEYYVNSADGSILFPGGPSGFFKSNFEYSNNDGTIDAAIWLANGQMVSYVYDADEGVKRAITRESAQTAKGRMDVDQFNMMDFFHSSSKLGEHPDPLPSHVTWNGITQGYKGILEESYTGLKNTWTIYFDAAPTVIKTSPTMVGFMVGVLKDTYTTKCNRLAVFTKVEIGGEDSKDFIQMELKSIKPMGITFDGSDYRPLTVEGDMGTDALATQDHYEARFRSIEVRRRTKMREKERCVSKRCVEQKDAELEALRQEKYLVICQMSVAMGMESSVEECLRENQ